MLSCDSKYPSKSATWQEKYTLASSKQTKVKVNHKNILSFFLLTAKCFWHWKNQEARIPRSWQENSDKLNKWNLKKIQVQNGYLQQEIHDTKSVKLTLIDKSRKTNSRKVGEGERLKSCWKSTPVASDSLVWHILWVPVQFVWQRIVPKWCYNLEFCDDLPRRLYFSCSLTVMMVKMPHVQSIVYW